MQALRRTTAAFLSALASTVAIAEQPWIIDPHTHFKGPEQIAFENQTVKREPQNTLGHVVVPEDYRFSTAKDRDQSLLSREHGRWQGERSMETGGRPLRDV